MLTSYVLLTYHKAIVVEQLIISGRYQDVSNVLRDELRMIEKLDAEDAHRLEARGTSHTSKVWRH